ncbi:phosphoglycerate mutase-like protein [Myriangium duriaei CBS 260.36]|uniref:Phosphoglycerate mutase-like protein n=1 Tax=Myriangium duriaei CBS 260.36 TaxID=1168546 RepID=A0A9P4MEA5_9PEZI|nr:phosphoglycerate mutase-like protein [Myriangium duriaei CBS 260.36]
MAPTIILIRHGEAEHNATWNHRLADPPLTKLGEEQCKQLSDRLQQHCPIADGVEAIISSPMVRTLQTTMIGLDWLIQRRVKVEADASWQELSAKPCDTGSPARAISERFPAVDFSSLDPIYPDKSLGTRYAYTRTKVLERGQQVLANLYNRPEKVIAVVSHSAFLRLAVSKRHYANADYRVFTFAGDSAEGDMRLVESELTKGEGGMGWSESGVPDIAAYKFPGET